MSGRGIKTLAEPDGNKAYVNAAAGYSPIRIMTAQAGAMTLKPLKVNSDPMGLLWQRSFPEPDQVRTYVANTLAVSVDERPAVHIGLHNTLDATGQWADLLLWLNDTYSKDGDNSVWVPSLEEYYEYAYYHTQGSVGRQVSGNTLILTVRLPAPAGKYFYYPSVTVNVEGLSGSAVTGVTANNAVTGLSRGVYNGSLTVSIDCRKELAALARHFVEVYEADKGSAIKRRTPFTL